MARGTVKFFNPGKGFGFIAPEDGTGDVFVHVSALERSGLSELNDGDVVEFELEQDRRSGKMAAVDLQVIGSGPAPQRSRFDRPAPGRGDGGFQARRPPPRDGGGFGGGSGGGGPGRGVVKWFNPTKGFGFIQPDGGGADVFVHISAVERSGLSELHEGQVVAYELAEDRRSGKLTATNLRPA